MKPKLFRILPLFLAALLCVGVSAAPQDAPLARSRIAAGSAAKAPVPVKRGEVLWYAGDYTIPSTFDPQALLSLGVTGAIINVPGIAFGPQNRTLSLDELRGWAQQVKTAAGPLPVWWQWSVVSQIPPRTLCAPKDQAKRTMILDNYASIGSVAKKAGFVGLALDSEAYGLSTTAYPDEPGTRALGGDLARACRRDNAGLKLCAFGPLGPVPPGFKKLWKGFSDGAGKGFVFYTEDSYGLTQVDPKRALQHCSDATGCDVPGLGWWPDGHAVDPVPWIEKAAAKVQGVRKAGVPVFLYREGVMGEGARAALGRVLAGS